MKKVLFLICLLLLSGCGNNYFKELGYTSTQIKTIKKLGEEDQVFFAKNYGEYTCAILDDVNFDETKVSTYLLYQDILPATYIVELVNNEIIDETELEAVKTLVSYEDFELNNLEEYLKYPLNNPCNVLIYVNEDLNCDYSYVEQLAEDIAFISDNLPLYVQYADQKENTRDLIEYVNTRNYLTYYSEQIRADIEKYGDQVLVNKFYYLDETYEPSDLVDVEATYGRGQLRSVAYEAFKAMYEAAKAEGMNFYITSPYRSYETQDKLYNYYLSFDSQAEVDIYSARPGSSEHQLGLAVDILKNGYDFGNFEITAEAEWLANNAYKYGFILRYPADKVAITGYKYESWHYRYVGDIAEDVYNSGLSYDEYFEKFVK